MRDAMVPEIDAQYGVYVRGRDGEWHFNMELFAAYLQRNGIVWPRTERGTLSLKRKTFEDMARAIRSWKTCGSCGTCANKMRKVKLAVGADGRNRTVLWPFQSKDVAHAAEGIAVDILARRLAALSDQARARARGRLCRLEFDGVHDRGQSVERSGDAGVLPQRRSLLVVCKRVGAAPPDATKQTHGMVRCATATRSACSQSSTASRRRAWPSVLGVSTFEAHEMIAQHRELFAVYWRWAEDWLAAALDSGEMRTVLGWRCRTGVTEFNSRSIQNFAGAGNRRGDHAHRLHLGGAARAHAVRSGARCPADRGADRADRRRRGAAEGDHAPGLAGGAQRHGRRHP